MKPLSKQVLIEQMVSRYGATLTGQDLYSTLGFKTYSSFHRSRVRGELGVNVFTLPGRRGWFALTTEVAEWLVNHRNSTRNSAQRHTS